MNTDIRSVHETGNDDDDFRLPFFFFCGLDLIAGIILGLFLI